MKIAQFTSSLLVPLGGAEQYCLTLARHQQSSGHQVTIVTGWADAEVVDALERDGITVVVIPSARAYSPDQQGSSPWAKVRFHLRELGDSVRRTRVSSVLESSGFDVVHVHRFAGFGTAVLRLRGVPVVHTVHDFTLVDTSASLVRGGRLMERPSLLARLRMPLILRGVPRSTSLVFPAERTKQRHSEWGFPTERFHSIVVPHGWPRPGATDSSDPLPPAEPATLSVLFLGKLAAHKGIPVLLAAWADGIRGAVLRVGGDGPLASEVAATASLEALGWLDEKARTAELTRADVLVFPSEWPENFPIVIAESMLAGVPVLTTTVASPPLVDDGESGLVVQQDAAAIRSAIERLVVDLELRERLTRGARDRADLLDMNSHGRMIERVYRGS